MSPERAIGPVADVRVEDPRDGQDLWVPWHPTHAISRGGTHDARIDDPGSHHVSDQGRR